MKIDRFGRISKAIMKKIRDFGHNLIVIFLKENWASRNSTLFVVILK
jgi:hypothetical protein